MDQQLKINKSFAVIGGGTGTFSVLSGLKKYTDKITAIVTMADSGGSAKKERDEWGLLPSSDIRKSLLALADVSTNDSMILRKLFEYRFAKGHGMTGMTFGNLFIVALSNILHSQQKAIEKAGELLKIKGKVLPVSLDKVDLIAEYENGKTVIGEHYIDEPETDGKLKITKLWTKPKAEINPEVKKILKESDVIIIGPGGFYTTVLANLVIKGVPKAIEQSKAVKIFILNLMTEYGQTYNFKASHFIKIMSNYLNIDCLDHVLLNNTPITETTLIKYKRFHAIPVVNDLNMEYPFKVIARDLLSSKIFKKEKGDLLKRSLIRHNPEKIAKICLDIIR